MTATGNTEVEGFYPIIFANFLNSPEKIAQVIATPGAGGGGSNSGGGGGDGDAAEEEKEEEEKVEEEEMDLGGGMDMFGAEAGEGGDY